jgi:ParB/RepB/Spo0J family partition protein
MQINLSRIKASPKPIRTKWDEEGIENLRWSFMEEGQVEPVGLYELDKDYIIVWGHRRVEAARRAGWNEIEAVIVPQDEVNNLVQSGIENLSKESMSIEDKANWAFRLTELGLSQREISRRSTIPVMTINQWITYRQEKEQGVLRSTPDNSDLIYGNHLTDADAPVVHEAHLVDDKTKKEKEELLGKVLEVKQALGDDTEAKKALLGKVVDENLTRGQTRELAKAYRVADTPEMKQRVLDIPIIKEDNALSILNRAKYTDVSTKKTEFSWLRQQDIMETLDSIKAIGKVIDILRNDSRGEETALELLIRIKNYTHELAQKAEEAIKYKEEKNDRK